MTQLKEWARTNSGLLYFLIAQLVAVGGGAAALIAYSVKLETRVMTMETRGAEYTVARMEEMKTKIAVLEHQINKNDDRIERIVDVMTKKLNINP